MEGVRSDSCSCRYVAAHLKGAPFTLLDVGCSGGIDAIWRLFRERLRAFCFDQNIAECERLIAAEGLPHVRYFPACVGAPSNHPAVARRGDRAFNERNPWTRGRLAATRSLMLHPSPQICSARSANK